MATKIHQVSECSVPCTIESRINGTAETLSSGTTARAPGYVHPPSSGSANSSRHPRKLRATSGNQREATNSTRTARLSASSLQQRSAKPKWGTTSLIVNHSTSSRQTSASKSLSGKKEASRVDVESTDEQDIKFINVDSARETGNTYRGSKTVGSQQLRLINPSDVLQTSREARWEDVFEVDLHSSRIGRIKNLDKFTKLKILDLSGNYIGTIENLDSNVELKELKLYDNDIEMIQNLEKLTQLCHLQLQHNRIKSIGRGLQGLSHLRVLRLDSNSLTRLEVRELCGASQLSTLDLSNNNLDNIAAVCCLPNLSELFVVNNRLRTLCDLSRCKKLQELDVSNNRLTDLSAVKGLWLLTTLKASHNHLTSLKTLTRLKGLQELDLSHNRINRLGSLPQTYPGLQILHLNDNQLDNWQDVSQLKELGQLAELSLWGNPFSQDPDKKLQYASELQILIPHLEILDGVAHRKSSTLSQTPIMRPMSASAVISARQVESHLLKVDTEMTLLEQTFTARFDSLRCTMERLPSQGAIGAPSSGTPTNDGRPSSKCGKRSRIKDALAFASQNFLQAQLSKQGQGRDSCTEDDLESANG